MEQGNHDRGANPVMRSLAGGGNAALSRGAAARSSRSAGKPRTGRRGIVGCSGAPEDSMERRMRENAHVRCEGGEKSAACGCLLPIPNPAGARLAFRMRNCGPSPKSRRPWPPFCNSGRNNCKPSPASRAIAATAALKSSISGIPAIPPRKISAWPKRSLNSSWTLAGGPIGNGPTSPIG